MGEKRSPIASAISRELAKKYKIADYGSNSFGIDTFEPDLNIFNKYDKIFVMEQEFKERLINNYNIPKKKIINLDVSDQHSITERKFRELLEKELTEKLEPYFKK